MADITDEKAVKRVTVDNQTTEMQDLDDQIKWEKWQNEKAVSSANSKTGGVRFLKGINPGTV
jgi:hypothetical protein